jgi:hypothetical protein
MRLVTALMIVTLSLEMGTLPAFASSAATPRFGVYTANVALGGGGRLEAIISVLEPPTKVTLVFDCSKPRGRDTVTDVLNAGPVALHGGAFKFVSTAKLSKFTTVTENNTLVSQSTYTAAVNVSGAFTAHHQFTGAVQLGGSSCAGSEYTTIRKAAPVPEVR